MGSACSCVAMSNRTLPNRTNNEALHRSIGYSPSWSFRWDNRGRVAGEEGNLPDRYSHGINQNVGLEFKGRMAVQTEDISGGGSPLENFQIPSSQKSPIHEQTIPASDLSMGSGFSTEVKDLKDLTESSAIADPSASTPAFCIPSTSSLSSSKSDLSFSQAYHIPADSTPSRCARRSPGHQLLRGISDSRILGLKSPNNSMSEGRQSFILSTCSNDLTMGSQCGSSDGWSMRTFSELVASSQRERWSLDSETLDSVRGKITRSNSWLLASPSIDLQTCGVCSKLLTERSSWTANELSVVAVLVCGHVYHTECLENVTSERDRYDPSCPVCMSGEKQALRMSGKGLKAEAGLKSRSNWMSRNRVVDSDHDGDSVLSDHRKSTRTDGKGPKLEPSSSTRSSFGRPFLKRHFSLGSKSTRTLSMNETPARRKGFWARYRKE